LDYDQGGNNMYQLSRTYFGPSLGWAMTEVLPTQAITSAGTTTIGLGASVVLVNVAAAVTLNLPSVVSWARPINQPAALFYTGIWIKDLGGNAGSFAITINPAIGELIDWGASTTISVAHGFVHLYPLPDLTGWYSA
jgi:hypothetical protein